MMCKKTTIIGACVFCLAGMLTAGTAPIFLAFNAGEVSDRVKYRLDIAQHEAACSTLENMIVLPQGAAMRRPGTEYIAATKNNGQVRLISFESSVGDTYVLEFGNLYMRVFRDGGQMLTGYGDEDYSGLTAYGDLTAHWRLNEDDDSTTVFDETESYNGVLDGNSEDVHWYGKVGTGCFNFNRSETVTISDNDAFSFAEDDPFTLSAWVYVTDTDAVQTILSKWDNSGPAREWRLNLQSDETLRFEIYDDSLNLTANCVSQWKLNENAANTSVVDSQLTQDGVSSANTSVLYNPAGKIGSCFDFDGQYNVLINDNDAYTFNNAGQDEEFSIAAWIYSSGFKWYDSIVAKYNEAPGAEKREYRLYANGSGVLYFRLYDETNNGNLLRLGDETLSRNTWYFVVATYDGSESQHGLHLYVNGEDFDGSAYKSGTYNGMVNQITNLRIGAFYGAEGTSGSCWNGRIDNVCIFDKKLSSDEILSLYSAGAGTESLAGDSPYATSDEPLTGGWRFVAATYDDADGGADAADSMTLYVDGAAVAATAHNSSSYVKMENTDADVRIGAQYSAAGANQYVFADKIDDAAVWDDALSADEIAEMYTEDVYEIETVFTTEMLSDLQSIQKNDIIYLVTETLAPRKLSRYDHDLWILEAVEFTWGPFLSENTTAITLTPSDVTGTITVTAGSSLFVPDDVGAIWRISGKQDPTYVTATVDDSPTSTDTLSIKGDYSLRIVGTYNAVVTLERSNDSGSTWEPVYQFQSGGDAVNDEHLGDEPERGYIYRVTMEDRTSGSAKVTLTAFIAYNDGYVRITDYIDAATVQADVIETLADTTATKRWAEGAFSEKNGYPRTVGFYQQRAMYAGSTEYPTTLWASKSFELENFDVGSGLDNEAIIYDITIAKQNPVLWIYDLDTVLVGTGGGIFRWGAMTPGDILTPENPTTRRLSGYGVSSIPPSFIAESLLFVERGGHKVDELAYQLEADGYVVGDMTLLATHLFANSPVTATAAQTRPTPILWALREDGTLCSLSFVKAQEVAAWSRQNVGGRVESITVIPAADEDELWMATARTINGSAVRYIERLKPFDFGADPNDAWFVDCGFKYGDDDAETPTDTITGLDALEGETVQVFTGDGYETAVVDANTIELSETISECIIGRPFTSTLTTLPLETQTQSGFTIGKKKQVRDIFCAFENSCAFEYTDSFGTWWTVRDDAKQTFTTPTTGYAPVLPITGRSAYEIQISLRQQWPYPMTITAIYPSVEY